MGQQRLPDAVSTSSPRTFPLVGLTPCWVPRRLQARVNHGRGGAVCILAAVGCLWPRFSWYVTSGIELNVRVSVRRYL